MTPYYQDESVTLYHNDFMHQYGPTEHAIRLADLILGSAA